VADLIGGTIVGGMSREREIFMLTDFGMSGKHSCGIFVASWTFGIVGEAERCAP
jgi:hypothetical protein